MATLPQASVDPFALLSDYAAVQMVYAADVTGIWHALAKADVTALDIAEFVSVRRLCLRSITAITDYLVRAGFLEHGDSARTSIRLAAAGRTFLDSDCLGHFALFAGAYGQVLQSTAELATGRKTYGVDICRDLSVLAIASTKIGQSKVHSSYEVVLEHAGTGDVGCVIDIGCGAADFLAVLAQRTHARKVLGIDIASSVCDLARSRLAIIGGTSEVICADISNLGQLADAYHNGADLVTALFVLHELIGKQPGIEDALLAIRGLLRAGGRFLLLEKATDVLRTVRNPPYFSEFKLIHDLTGQNLFERRQWNDLLERVGFEITQERLLAPHTGSVLFECTRPV
jgi:SAM-dependent methyltransferase